MRVFIAGGTGVIGRGLVPMLVSAGHTVIGTARGDDGARTLQALGGEPVIVDVLDHDAVVEAVRGARPDAVVHQLTALSARSFDANSALRVHGTRNLVEAALAAGTRRLVAQSIAWAYVPGDAPAVETEPLDLDADEPRSLTVSGVASLESAVAELAEPVVLRYGTLYGPGTWYANDGLFADQVRAGRLPADESVTSFLHIDDAARACCLALDWEPCTANVCDDDPATAAEWVPLFAQAVDAPEPTTQRGRPDWARGADNHFARHTLGWTPRFMTWRDGFRIGL
jgi:nucleoside-diphosphate-sugar epimerase